MPEFTIIQSDLVKDYMDFINALNYKFVFEDKEKFEEDFILLLEQVNPNGNYNAGKVFDGFANLLRKHSAIKDLEHNVSFALAELQSLGQEHGN